MAIGDLRKNEMMSHLLDSLEAGKDIGEYGRLVFAMVGRHFLKDEELVSHLSKNPRFSEEDARALVLQAQERDYNPPKRDKIMHWQSQQDFAICPGDDPDGCNVYKNLKFPDGVFEKINEYYHEKAAG
jgi:hypothetical protein